MRLPEKAREPAPATGEKDAGITAVFLALVLVLVVGFAALGVDISKHTNTRQRLWDTLDSASLAGASLLPDGETAYQAAYDYALTNMPDISPVIDFWCVVGVDGSGNPDSAHIPVVCDPGPAPYVAGAYPGLECTGRMCLIPCNPLTPEFD